MITSHGGDEIKRCSQLPKSNIFDNKEFTRVCILDQINANNTSGHANGTDTNVKSSWTNKAGTFVVCSWFNSDSNNSGNSVLS